jgi:hypothetical protein
MDDPLGLLYTTFELMDGQYVPIKMWQKACTHHRFVTEKTCPLANGQVSVER